MSRQPRSIAFYLPQYHPIPENDEWWGAGFTEWTNVVKARPAYRHHYQPHLPGELGFYDLRVPEVRAQQATLAADHGVSAFCYYHYWFGGRRLLQRPFDEVLASGEPDFPFLLCWANEPWSRRWDGSERSVLMPQEYGVADHRAHVRWLAEAWADPRYVRVDGKPLFLVYRAAHVPDVRALTDTFRAEADRLGVGELYLVRVESFFDDRADPRPLGFDAGVEFQPDVSRAFWQTLHELSGRLGARESIRRQVFARVGAADSFVDDAGTTMTNSEVLDQVGTFLGRRLIPGHHRHFVFDYEWLVRLMEAVPPVGHPRFPSVAPSWDNTPRRREGGIVLQGANPAAFERWMAGVLGRSSWRGDEDLIFVNAWNEWAEGCHLEPDQRWGRGWLEAHARALASVTERGSDGSPPTGLG